MKDTGVWIKAELDDEGNFTIKVNAAAEWKENETVTVGEDVTDRVPKDIIDNLKLDLNRVIAASKQSMMKWAQKAAVEMANFKNGKKEANTISLDFSGNLSQEGKME